MTTEPREFYYNLSTGEVEEGDVGAHVEEPHRLGHPELLREGQGDPGLAVALADPHGSLDGSPVGDEQWPIGLRPEPAMEGRGVGREFRAALVGPGAGGRRDLALAAAEQALRGAVRRFQRGVTGA